MKLRLLEISFRYAVAPPKYYQEGSKQKPKDDLYEPFLEDYEWMGVDDINQKDTPSKVFWSHKPNDSFRKDDCYDQITGVEFRYELTTSHYKDGIEIPLTYMFCDDGRFIVYDDPLDDEDMGYEYGNGYSWSDIEDVPIKNLIKEHKKIIDRYHTEKL